MFDEDNWEITPRLILQLVKHLPETSATVAAIRGGQQFRPWTQDTYMLALLANLLYGANRQRAGKATRSPLVKPPQAKQTEKPKVVDLKQVQARIRRRALIERIEKAKRENS